MAAAQTTAEFDQAVLRGFVKQVALEVELAPTQSLEQALAALKLGKVDLVTGLRHVGGEKPAELAVSVDDTLCPAVRHHNRARLSSRRPQREDVRNARFR